MAGTPGRARARDHAGLRCPRGAGAGRSLFPARGAGRCARAWRARDGDGGRAGRGAGAAGGSRRREGDRPHRPHRRSPCGRRASRRHGWRDRHVPLGDRHRCRRVVRPGGGCAGRSRRLPGRRGTGGRGAHPDRRARGGRRPGLRRAAPARPRGVGRARGGRPGSARTSARAGCAAPAAVGSLRAASPGPGRAVRPRRARRAACARPRRGPGHAAAGDRAQWLRQEHARGGAAPVPGSVGGNRAARRAGRAGGPDTPRRGGCAARHRALRAGRARLRHVGPRERAAGAAGRR